MEQKTCRLCGQTISNEISAKMKTSIDELGLSTRAKHCLLRRDIKYIEELVKLDITELMRIRNLGIVSLNEINEKVKAFGLKGWHIKNWKLLFKEG